MIPGVVLVLAILLGIPSGTCLPVPVGRSLGLAPSLRLVTGAAEQTYRIYLPSWLRNYRPTTIFGVGRSTTP